MGSGSDGNKGVLRILQHHGNLTIRFFTVISGHSLAGVLLLCREAVSVFYSQSRLGNRSCFFSGSKMAHRDTAIQAIRYIDILSIIQIDYIQ